MSSSATNLKMFKVWFDCARQLKSTRCWELTSRLAATTNNYFSGFIKSNPSTTIIYFLWTLLRHGYIERRRHGHNSNFLRATESCTRLHQTAPGCTRLHQAAPGCTRLHQAAPGCTRLHQIALFVYLSFSSLIFCDNFNARLSGYIMCSFFDVKSIQQFRKSQSISATCAKFHSPKLQICLSRKYNISHKSKERAMLGYESPRRSSCSNWWKGSRR